MIKNQWRMPKLRSGTIWKSTTFWPTDYQEAIEQSLIRILAIAHQERLDADKLVSCLANEHRGYVRFRMERLAKRLSAGVPLPSALEQTRDVLSDDKVLAIRFGYQSGTLTATYRDLIAQSQQISRQVKSQLRQSLVYLTALALVMFLLMLFQATFVLPTYKSMLEEAGISMEHKAELTSFRWLMYASDLLSSNAVWLGAVVVGIMLMLGVSSARAFLRRRVFPRIYRPIASLRSAQLLNLLSVAEEQGRPIPSALSTLARYHFDRWIRLKLLIARNDVEQGVDVWKALSDADLISTAESQSLASSGSGANRKWLMRLLATWRAERIEKRESTMLALFQPALIVFLGGIVLWISTAAFGMLSFLISSLS